MSQNVYTTDTLPEAEAVQLNQMTPQQRIAKACALSANVRRMAFQAIERRHPEYTADEVKLAFNEVIYGKDLADDVRRWQQEQDS